MALNNFTQRTLSGAAYVAVIVVCLWLKPEYFYALLAVMAFLAVREFNRLQHPRTWTDILSEMSALMLVFIGRYGFELSELALLYLLPLGGALIGELWTKSEHPVQNWGNVLVGQVMIALPFAMMGGLSAHHNLVMLAIFVLIWVNDSGAYCVGVLTAKRKNGNHKMFPRVSPKKSWEGLIGGIVFAIGAAMLMVRYGWFDQIGQQQYPYLLGGLFALVVCIFGTLGDLMESLFKRSIGVKDSGYFLPGHGGVLDRFDSILLAAPAAMLCIYVYMLLM